MGQQIDVSLLDTQIAMLANQAMNWLVGGIVPVVNIDGIEAGQIFRPID